MVGGRKWVSINKGQASPRQWSAEQALSSWLQFGGGRSMVVILNWGMARTQCLQVNFLMLLR